MSMKWASVVLKFFSFLKSIMLEKSEQNSKQIRWWTTASRELPFQDQHRKQFHPAFQLTVLYSKVKGEKSNELKAKFKTDLMTNNWLLFVCPRPDIYKQWNKMSPLSRHCCTFWNWECQH